MFRTLLESRATRSRRMGGIAMSVALHVAAITLAIVATARATIAPAVHVTDVIRTYVVPDVRHEPDAPAKGTSQLERIVVPPVNAPVLPRIVIGNEPPRIDLGRAILDGPVFVGSASHLGGGVIGANLASSGSSVETAGSVDKAVAPQPGNPAPIYPAELRAAQIEGTVLARFIVDTTGHAEAASIGFPEATHPRFAEAVRQSILRSRYLPALLGGRAVRQLVEQRFGFTLVR